MSKHHPGTRKGRHDGGRHDGRRRASPRGRETTFVGQMVGGCLTVGAITFALAPEIQSSWRVATQPTEKVDAAERSIHYQDCDAARAAGAAPIYRGSPGYREGMDGDSDGIACEPYH